MTGAGVPVDVRMGIDRIVAALGGSPRSGSESPAGSRSRAQSRLPAQPQPQPQSQPQSQSEPHGRPAPVVLLDGRSGSGKSTIATQVGERMPRATLLRLDDVYPGWDGLQAASDQLVTGVLEPFSRGEPGRWRRWDWQADAPGTEETVDAGRPLLVEGCGALSVAARRLAVLGAWVELDDRTRHERAIERDGDAYAPFWKKWAAQEEVFLAREHPSRSADLVIDGHGALDR